MAAAAYSASACLLTYGGCFTGTLRFHFCRLAYFYGYALLYFVLRRMLRFTTSRMARMGLRLSINLVSVARVKHSCLITQPEQVCCHWWPHLNGMSGNSELVDYHRLTTQAKVSLSLSLLWPQSHTAIDRVSTCQKLHPAFSSPSTAQDETGEVRP